MNTDTPTSAASIPTALTRHPRCGSAWTGTRTSHCSCCCITFSGTSAFDLHQRLDNGILTCESPEKIGLVPVEKPWGAMWSWPSTDRNPWNAESGDGDA